MLTRLGHLVAACAFVCAAAHPASAYVDSRYDSLAAAMGGLEAMDAWDIPEAERIIEGLAASRTASQEILPLLRARLAYYRGDYKEAARLADTIPEALRAREDIDALVQIIRDTAVVVPPLEVVSSEHFSVSLDPRDRVLSLYALDALEKAYDRIGRVFALRPAERIRVEVLPDSESFRRVSSLTTRDIETSGAVGICKFNKIMVLTPRALLRGYRWLDTLAHEYVHYLVVRLSGNRAPIWLHEGLASTYQQAWRTEERPFPTRLDASLLARALGSGKLYTLEEMDPSLIRLPTPGDVATGFAQVSSILDYLIATYGDQVTPRLLAAYRRGLGLKQAISEALGVEYERFVADWERWLKGRGYVEVPGILPPVFTLAEGEKPPLSEEEIVTTAARQRSRLALHLEAIGRPLAAYLEYKRALEEEPLSPFVLARAAATAVDAGRPGDAAALVETGLANYPDYALLWLTKGRVAVARGDNPAAVRAFEQVIAINPYDPEPHGMLQKLSFAAGDRRVADREGKALQYLGHVNR